MKMIKNRLRNHLNDTNLKRLMRIAMSRNEVGRLQTKFSTYLEKIIGVSVCKLCSCHEQSHNLY